MYYTTQRNQLYINQSNQINNVMSRRKRKQPIYHFNKINILIRNTYRPNTFSKCIQSVLMQEYTNYRIIMCYDDDRCMEYLEEYRNHNKIELFKVNRETEASHFYNLYCNHLLDRVRDGWILFLNDDNMLAHPDTLKKINNNIKTEGDIIFWKVKLGEHIIYPNIYDIKYGQIDSAGFCFHSKYKNAARWIAEQGSDFHYVTQLLKKHYLIRRAHSEILTQSVLLTKVNEKWKKVDVNKYMNINDKNTLYTEITGGLGNQLFMIFNIISLSQEYNCNFKLDYNRNYKKDYQEARLHKNPDEYAILSKLDFIKFKKDKLTIYQEPVYKYNKIELEKDKNYEIKGYFQSYKYFWKHRDIIKNYLNIDICLIDSILEKYKLLGKKILSIHVRLGDYVNLQDYHPIPSLEYYKQALSYYNLNNYQIILFSDDVEKAKEKLKPLELDLIFAQDIYDNDEDQLYMLMLSDVVVCANSTFSLMSCYLNEIYGFKKDVEYILPHKFFGKSGPKYDIFDLIPIENSKFRLCQTEKCAVIFYHKNITKLYKKRWVDKCVQSILDQEKINFDIFEINYGNEDYSVFENIEFDKKINYSFYKKDYSTHTEAMIFLLKKLFEDLDYDFIFNTNLDDYYDTKRFYYQYYDLINSDSVLNSTLFNYINENSDGEDVKSNYGNTLIYSKEKLTWAMNPKISDVDYNINIPYNYIKEELIKRNNYICHPGVCFTKDFWNSIDYYGNKIRYRNDKPFEDISLWKRTVESNVKLSIVNKNLVNYRLHESQICSKEKNRDKLSSEEKKEFKNEIDNRSNIKGVIIVLENINDFNMIKKNELDHYFLYVNKNILNELIKYLTKIDIYYYHYVCFDNKINIENINDKEIIKLFDVKVELNCDKIIKIITSKKNIQVNNEENIVFYSVLYKLNSKFEFRQYIEWAKITLNCLKNVKLLLFTNKETYTLINQNIPDINDYNIDFIFIEYEEFQLYKYQKQIKKNIVYWDRVIDWKVILLYINRHLFLEKVKNKIKSKRYAFVDIGYFRHCEINESNKFNFTKLNNHNDELIYLGYTLTKKNKENLLKLHEDKINNLDKFKSIEPLLKNLYLIGGGFNVVPYKKVGYWLDSIKNEFSNFIKNDTNFKDDQVLIFKIFIKDKNNFNVIENLQTCENNVETTWFPFIKYFFEK